MVYLKKRGKGSKHCFLPQNSCVDYNVVKHTVFLSHTHNVVLLEAEVLSQDHSEISHRNDTEKDVRTKGKATITTKPHSV